MAIRQIETLEEIDLERFGRLTQYIGRNRIGAVSGKVTQGEDVHRGTIEIESDTLAIGDDPSTVRLVDQRAQAGLRADPLHERHRWRRDGRALRQRRIPEGRGTRYQAAASGDV